MACTTLSNDQNYALEAGGTVFIAGKANILTTQMYTPRGRVTDITDEQYAVLRKNHVFQLHEKNGFIAVAEITADPEKVATKMEASTLSAPDTPESFEVDNKKVQKNNKKGK
ncbi:hypothetical protein [Erwinia amylovora]|uniref:hypothetical protein n=1 Tax=Erwinia amylovora TaxID=552 RepID=UPI0014447BFD|nr:hypothetical protein [Erwinia amylovora]